MTNEELHETQETKIDSPSGEDTSPTDISEPKKRKRRPWLRRLGYIFLGLLILLIVSAFFGYRNGIRRRKETEANQATIAAATQFELGLADMAAGNYEIARQRFEYVLSINPTYPGVTEMLAEVILVSSITATPTLAPTPTSIPVTPTPDSRAEEEQYAQIEGYMANKDWDAAVAAIEELRKKNPDFRAIDLDGMLYLALRQRGALQIGLGNLEVGIYNLTLAETFGVLDTEADGLRTWARYYITGASFWDIDWPQAIEYFSQVAAQYPNMHDGSNWTAAQRYVDALIGYAQQLEREGKFCEVDDVYNQAHQYTGNASYLDSAAEAQANCQ